MIQLTDKPVDAAAVLESVRSPAAGAAVLFLGTAREMTEGRRTSHLEYEAYPEMAHFKLAELEQEARRRWPLIECAVVHRLGHLAVGEICVAIAVSSGHREPAFEAGKWLIDRIKHVVPIWKKEIWADGTGQWVHPGLDTADVSDTHPATSGTDEEASGTDQGDISP